LIAWKPTTLTYAATTYWYARPGTAANVSPQPEAAALPVPTLAAARAAAAPPRKPDALECEDLPVKFKTGAFFVGEQDMEPFGAARWSGGRQLLGQATAVGDAVELEFRAPDAAPRKLVLFATRAPDYGILQLAVNGQAVPARFDGYAAGVQPAPPVALGVFTPREGVFRLRVEVAGANPAASGARHYFGLDCIVMEAP